MKQKIKDFFIQKKELLLFLGVLTTVFAMIITIASLTPNEDAEPVLKTDDTPTVTKDDSATDPNVTEDPKEHEKMILPIAGEHEIVRYYFDIEDAETMTKAVIYNGETYIESKGVGYAKSTGEEFSCLAVFSGTVDDILEDSTNGTTVTINHNDDVVSVYYCLRNVTVKIGDEVSQGDVIGTSGVSALDPSAGVHVHLEIKKDGEYINPTNVFDKKTSEITNDSTK